MTKDHVIGLDYRTDSVRALIVDARDGREISSSVHNYKRWPKGEYRDPGKNQFRQHPLDYLEGLEDSIAGALAAAPPGTAEKIATAGPYKKETKMKKVHLYCVILLAATSLSAAPKTPPPSLDDMLNYDKNATIFREGTEWSHVWIPQAKQNNKPYVLLVGDSITMQYQKAVTKTLAPIANVGYLTTSLSVADPLYPTLLTSVLCLREYNVIHFNSSLHGPQYTDKQYQTGYEKAIKLIKKLQPKAKIVLVTSTALQSGKDDKFQKKVLRRDEIVQKLAKKNSLAVDDLYAVVVGKDELHNDKFHFKNQGATLLAEQVVKTLKPMLKK